MAKTPFTEKELITELVSIIDSLSGQIDESLGPWFYVKALDIPSQESITLSKKPLTEEDLESFPITESVRRLYEYATETRWHADWPKPIDVLVDLEEFAFLFRYEWNNPEDSGVAKLRLLHDVAEARCFLEDEPCELTFRQIALLANLDERTVRNAASLKHGDRIKTVKRGGRTYVEPEDALEWLSKRPDFKRVQIIASPLTNNPRYFEDAQGFGRFVAHRRKELGLSSQELAARLGWTEERADTIPALEEGEAVLRLEEVESLGLAIEEEDIPWLLNSFLRVFHLKVLAILDRELDITRYSKPEDAPLLDLHLALFRNKELARERNYHAQRAAIHQAEGGA
jgi:transcriptional regulator with XRE-family HTH domain